MMPNKDGSGPQGKGPKTGRELGDCEDTTPQKGKGRGRNGQGRGKGQGQKFWGKGKMDGAGDGDSN